MSEHEYSVVGHSRSKIGMYIAFFAGTIAGALTVGIVDQDYIDRSGDKTYAAGQRLIIRDFAVREFADLIEELGQELTKRVKKAVPRC